MWRELLFTPVGSASLHWDLSTPRRDSHANPFAALKMTCLRQPWVGQALFLSTTYIRLILDFAAKPRFSPVRCLKDAPSPSLPIGWLQLNTQGMVYQPGSISGESHRLRGLWTGFVDQDLR